MNRSESKYFNTAVRMDEAFLELLTEKDFAYITVKEICARAGVNRSTFYLHYETMADLLNESIAYMERQFLSYFSAESQIPIQSIGTADLKDLYLITPKYLLPFLQYVKDHQRVFRAGIEKTAIFGSQSRMNLMFEHVFNPIMDRYQIPEAKRPFVLSYGIEGIIAIIKVWLRGDCREPIEFILEVITDCVGWQAGV